MSGSKKAAEKKHPTREGRALASQAVPRQANEAKKLKAVAAVKKGKK